MVNHPLGQNMGDVEESVEPQNRRTQRIGNVERWKVDTEAEESQMTRPDWLDRDGKTRRRREKSRGKD
jgi:hypothetical protein